MRLGSSFDYSDQVLYNFNRNQSAFTNLSKQLSSGLRINSAADDPSGYAIANGMQAISAGLEQGQQSIQTARNLLTVADGAMETITEILQRVRSLVVEANSTINSPGDVAGLQSEIDQLMLEINRISQNTNFNGKALLDGSLASTQAQPAQLIYAQNPTVGNSSFTLIDPTQTSMSQSTEQAQFSFTVDSYDPTTNLLQVTFTASSPDPNFGPAQQNVLHVQPGTNFFQELGVGSNPYVVFDQNNNPVFQFNFNNLSANDVGKEALVVSTPPQNAENGNPLEINTGTSEGSIISIAIGAMDTAHLGVSETVLGDTLMDRSAEVRVDNAIQIVTSTRAQLGAQEVALGYASNDAATQQVNQIASESSIRDLNIGSTVTAFTKEQILVNVGTSVLSQMEVNATSLTRILISAFGG